MMWNTMIQERDLLRMIAREPDDDALRLVCADWMEEQGRSDRAKFIRMQVRLAEIRRNIPPVDEGALYPFFGLSPCQGTWHSPGDSPERRNLAFQCRRLLDVHEEEWLTPFRGQLRHDWIWSRGFVETIDLDPRTLTVSTRELFNLHPIRRLILTGLRGKTDLLALVLGENRLTSLDLILK
jgi:uncharacterized protein (TIGR02996 family)